MPPQPSGVSVREKFASLSGEAAARLAAGAPQEAFALADRNCRLGASSARDLLLRAQAHRASGRLDAARRDLGAAVAKDPTDSLVDRAALTWGDDTLRLEAAARVAAHRASDVMLQRKAIAILFENGARAAHALRRRDRGVSGWLAWPDKSVLRIDFQDGGQPQSFTVDPDPQYTLAMDGVSAAEVAIETHDSGALPLSLLVDGEVVERIAPVSAERSAPRVLTRSAAPTADGEPQLTIVVPVYDDFAATRDCLEALARARPAFAHKIVVVDDASPNQALKTYLDEAAARFDFELSRNEVNLGFAASVNRALSTRSSGDVLLLNADAVVAPGAVDRLRALSLSSPDIGTVTPLSNNGELTSYPVANEANPMPTLEELTRRDHLARVVNGDALVDLPNGVGFCLYITQACLDAVGALPEIYAQGYYEDVEFCLAARERGFRNVAAAGAYVGHAGSKSFGARKRALVMRNLEIIEARFPGYTLETAAFVALDPLRAYRVALDAAEPPTGPIVVVASGPHAAESLGRRHAARISAEHLEVTVLHMHSDAHKGAFRLTAVGGGAPQTLRFDFERNGERERFLDYLGRLDVLRIDLFDPASLPEPALTALIAAETDIQLFCAALGWFLQPIAPRLGPCPTPDSPQPCDICRAAANSPQSDEPHIAGRRAKLAQALERAARIVPLDRMAEAFARRVFRSRAGAADLSARLQREDARRAAAAGTIMRLGVLCPHPSAAIDRLLQRLARSLAASNAPGSLVVFGVCLDDDALMATQKAFVTGPAAFEEYAEMAEHYEVDALLVPDRAGGFGDLDETAAIVGLPKAYFDWSFGAFAVEAGDLSLDPRICDEKAARHIVAWMQTERGRGE